MEALRALYYLEEERESEDEETFSDILRPVKQISAIGVLNDLMEKLAGLEVGVSAADDRAWETEIKKTKDKKIFLPIIKSHLSISFAPLDQPFVETQRASFGLKKSVYERCSDFNRRTKIHSDMVAEVLVAGRLIIEWLTL